MVPYFYFNYLPHQTHETERLSYESNLSELKTTANKQRTEIVDLYAKVKTYHDEDGVMLMCRPSQCAELESLKVQLDREAEKCQAREAEVERLRREATELQVLDNITQAWAAYNIYIGRPTCPPAVTRRLICWSLPKS